LTSARIKLVQEEESCTTPNNVQVIKLSGIDTLTNQTRDRSPTVDPDYVLVSKKAFEAEMNNKDQQINTLINTVNNL